MLSIAEQQRIDRNVLVADTYPTRGLFQGMSQELVDSRPEPEAVGGRAGWWGLDRWVLPALGTPGTSP